MRIRKAEAEARRARILEAIKKNPGITSRTLAERFRVTQSLISKICKDNGIKLEQRDLLEHKDLEGFGTPADPQWGYSGITREV